MPTLQDYQDFFKGYSSNVAPDKEAETPPPPPAVEQVPPRPAAETDLPQPVAAPAPASVPNPFEGKRWPPRGNTTPEGLYRQPSGRVTHHPARYRMFDEPSFGEKAIEFLSMGHISPYRGEGDDIQYNEKGDIIFDRTPPSGNMSVFDDPVALGAFGAAYGGMMGSTALGRIGKATRAAADWVTGGATEVPFGVKHLAKKSVEKDVARAVKTKADEAAAKAADEAATDPNLLQKEFAERYGTEPVGYTPGRPIVGNDAPLYIRDVKHTVKYGLFEADDLKPSHHYDTFEGTKGYPENVQERRYKEDAEQYKVIKGAKKLDPILVLTNNPDATNGPPIVTPDGIVLGGNGRAMMIQRAYKLFGGKKYKKGAEFLGGQVGIDPDQIKKMKNPVLVRIIEPGDTTVDGLHRLASQLNETPTLAKSIYTAAEAMGRNMDSATIARIGDTVAGKGKTLREVLRGKDGLDILDLLVQDGVIPESDRSAYILKKYGQLTRSGMDTIEQALLGSVVKNAELLEATPRSITNKLSSALTHITQLQARAGEGWDITPHIESALDLARMAKAAKMGIREFLGQAQIGDEAARNFSPESTVLAKHLLDTNSTSLRKRFAEYAGKARTDVKNQGVMFGGEHGNLNARDEFFNTFGRPESFTGVTYGTDWLNLDPIPTLNRAHGGPGSQPFPYPTPGPEPASIAEQQQMKFDFDEPPGSQKQEQLFGTPKTQPEAPAAPIEPEVMPPVQEPPPGGIVSMEPTGKVFQANDEYVRSADEAAGLLAPLTRYGREQVYSVIVDANGKVLDLERHASGLTSASQIDIPQLAGRAINTPGAKKVYFVHQHPSGHERFSPEDKLVGLQLQNYLKLKGIDSETIAIGDKAYSRFDPKGLTEGTGKVVPASGTKQIPATERMIDRPKNPTIIENHADFRTFIENDGLLDKEGFIFLDAKGGVLGHTPYEKGKAKRDVAGDIIAGAERHNAVTVVPFFRSTLGTNKRADVLDTIVGVRDGSTLNVPDVIYSDSKPGPYVSAQHEAALPPEPKYRTAEEQMQGRIVESSGLDSGTTLYGGLPIPEMAKLTKNWEKHIGTPLWDQVISKRIPDALEKVPGIGRGVKAARRALDYDYRGDLPGTEDYVRGLDETNLARQMGADYGVDLGNRLSDIPHKSQVRIAQSITGHRVKLTPEELALATEANNAMLSLGKMSADLGLLSEDTFFKNAGKYMPRLYTTKEYKQLLRRYGEKAPALGEADRFKRRRDIPNAVRAQMGEILTPGYPVSKGIIQLTTAIENAKLYRDIARRSEWAIPKNMQHNAQLPAGWKKLGGDKTLGDLKNAWVHPEVYDDIKFRRELPSATQRLMRRWLSRWKSGKVLWSWKTHVRNNFSNSIMGHLGGMPMYVQPKYLKAAISEMRNKGQYWQEAKRSGLLGTTFVDAELRNIFDKIQPILKKPPGNSLSGKMGFIGDLVTGLRRANKKAGDLYQLEEQVWKLAKHIHSRQKSGMTATEAATDASKWLFDYGRITKFQEKYRNSLLGAPFATFTFKALPRVAEAAVKTPHRFALPAAMIWGLERAAREQFGDTPEQAKAKKEMRPDWMKGSVLGIPNYARVPYTDEYGREHWLNLSYILPWGDLGESGGFLGIPGGISPGGHPLAKEAIEQAMNYDRFWGEEIVQDRDVYGLGGTGGLPGVEGKVEAAKKRLGHAYRTFAPTPFLDAGKVAATMKGDPDYRGRMRSGSVVAADVLGGLKAYPTDYTDLLRRSVTESNPGRGPIASKVRADLVTLQNKIKALKDRGKDTSYLEEQFARKLRQLQGMAQITRNTTEAFEPIRGR